MSWSAGPRKTKEAIWGSVSGTLGWVVASGAIVLLALWTYGLLSLGGNPITLICFAALTWAGVRIGRGRAVSLSQGVLLASFLVVHGIVLPNVLRPTGWVLPDLPRYAYVVMAFVALGIAAVSSRLDRLRYRSTPTCDPDLKSQVCLGRNQRPQQLP
jgi:hypothetical protein